MTGGPATTSPLVGRDGALAQIVELALDPEVGMVLLSGAAGVGKTRLADAALAQLLELGWRGQRVASAGLASSVPYAALTRFVPSRHDDLAVADGYQELALMRAIEDGLGVHGGQPVVLVADDIGTFDGSSFALLAHLAADRRLFVVATHRSGSPTGPLLDGFVGVGVVEMELPPLDRRHSAELIEALLGRRASGELTGALWERAEGNPLFMRELIADALEGGQLDDGGEWVRLLGPLTVGAGLGRQIARRIGRLEPLERHALELLALAGVLGADDLTVLTSQGAIETLESRQLIHVVPSGRRLQIEVAHPLYAEAVLADLPELARRRHHATLAAHHANIGSRRAGDTLFLARARLGSGEAMQTDAAVAAGEHALRLDLLLDAERFSRAAIAAGAGETGFRLLAESLARQGRFVEADEVLRSELADAVTDWDRVERAIQRSSNVLWGFCDETGARTICEECLSTLEPGPAADRVRAHLAWISLSVGQANEALARTEHLTYGDHPEVRYAVAAARATALVTTGSVEDAAALAQQAFDEKWGADIGSGSHMQHLIPLGFSRLYQPDFAAAEMIAEKATAECRRRGQYAAAMYFLDLSGWTQVNLGQMGQAILRFDEGARIANRSRVYAGERTALTGQTVAYAQLGLVDRAVDCLERLRSVRPGPDFRGGAEVARAEGWTLAALGDAAGGAAVMQQACEMAASSGRACLEALLRHDVGRLGYQTPAGAARLAELAEQSQGDLASGLAAHAAALVAGDAAALDLSAEHFAGWGAALWSAEASAQAADAWARAGNQRAAVASQRASEAAAALADAGITPPLARALRVEPLTRREREVALLAARGTSNADISARLHLSHRTVENHLRSVYRKVGIEGRHQLADALGPSDDADEPIEAN